MASSWRRPRSSGSRSSSSTAAWRTGASRPSPSTTRPARGWPSGTSSTSATAGSPTSAARRRSRPATSAIWASAPRCKPPASSSTSERCASATPSPRPRARASAASCSTACPTSPRSWPGTTFSRSGAMTCSRSGGSAARTTSRSSGSTTCRSPTASIRRSRPSGSRIARSGRRPPICCWSGSGTGRGNHARCSFRRRSSRAARLPRRALALDNPADRPLRSQSFAAIVCNGVRGGERMRTFRWLAPVRTAAAMLVAACGGSDNGGGGGGGSDQASSKPIRIGASLPLTGDFSEPGKAARQGYQVWQKMVNDQGGLLGRKVQIIVRDDASDQNTVVADYNALISRQKVDMLLGTFSSLLNLPASTVAEKNRMLYVEPAGGAPDIFSRGYKYIFFAQQATANHQGDVFAHYITSLPASERPKTAAYPTLDDPFAQPTSQGIEAIFKAAGIRTVDRKTYPADTNNFDSIVAGVKASKPDIVINGATFEDGVSFDRALLKANFKPHWLYQTSTPSFGDQFAKAIGPQNTTGIAYAVSHSVKAKTPGNDEFVAKYKQMYGGVCDGRV